MKLPKAGLRQMDERFIGTFVCDEIYRIDMDCVGFNFTASSLDLPVYTLPENNDEERNAKREELTTCLTDAELDELHIVVKRDAYIAGTRRNFVEKYENDFNFGAKDGKDIIILPVKAAWAFMPEPYEEMSKKYSLDFRFYGYECGMEFNQEIEVVDGETAIDREIQYDDYYWECHDPMLGG